MRSTLRPAVPPAVIASMFAAGLGAWNTLNTSPIDHWTGAFRRGATPWELMQDLGRWNVALAARQRLPWAHEAQQSVVGSGPWPGCATIPPRMPIPARSPR